MDGARFAVGGRPRLELPFDVAPPNGEAQDRMARQSGHAPQILARDVGCVHDTVGAQPRPRPRIDLAQVPIGDDPAFQEGDSFAAQPIAFDRRDVGVVAPPLIEQIVANPRQPRPRIVKAHAARFPLPLAQRGRVRSAGIGLTPPGARHDVARVRPERRRREQAGGQRQDGKDRHVPHHAANGGQHHDRRARGVRQPPAHRPEPQGDRAGTFGLESPR